MRGGCNLQNEIKLCTSFLEMGSSAYVFEIPPYYTYQLFRFTYA
jgi:hypothetical protein